MEWLASGQVPLIDNRPAAPFVFDLSLDEDNEWEKPIGADVEMKGL